MIQFSRLNVQFVVIWSNFLRMILQEIALSARRQWQILEKILAAGNGVHPRQSTKGIYVQNIENQKIGLLAGFHSRPRDIWVGDIGL